MGSTAEPERFGKVRPLGSKGSNPLQVLCIQVGLLNAEHTYIRPIFEYGYVLERV